jgi:hypothetical protein
MVGLLLPESMAAGLQVYRTHHEIAHLSGRAPVPSEGGLESCLTMDRWVPVSSRRRRGPADAGGSAAAPRGAESVRDPTPSKIAVVLVAPRRPPSRYPAACRVRPAAGATSARGRAAERRWYAGAPRKRGTTHALGRRPPRADSHAHGGTRITAVTIAGHRVQPGTGPVPRPLADHQRPSTGAWCGPPPRRHRHRRPDQRLDQSRRRVGLRRRRGRRDRANWSIRSRQDHQLRSDVRRWHPRGPNPGPRRPGSVRRLPLAVHRERPTPGRPIAVPVDTRSAAVSDPDSNADCRADTAPHDAIADPAWPFANTAGPTVTSGDTTSRRPPAAETRRSGSVDSGCAYFLSET